MNVPGASSDFAARLLAWQRRHGRHDLPWQGTRDPYRIWLSEIMLQQTQVGSVIPYYRRFLERFPDVAALAAAPAEAVLSAWAGLGYYARARNLHRCAQIVTRELDGRFPATAEGLAALPGIGRSTAAAIAAFACGERAAILDGNVKRVLCRHFGVEGAPGQAKVESALWALADSLLPESGIEAYTQGLMDLGATVCVRSRPACDACPLSASCVARRDGRQGELPARRPRPVRPEREAIVLLLDDGDRFYLEPRPAAGIWGGLLAPPELAVGEAPEAALRRLGLTLVTGTDAIETLPPVRHDFTHFRLHLLPLHVRIAPLAGVGEAGGLTPVARAELQAAPLPAPVLRLLAALT